MTYIPRIYADHKAVVAMPIFNETLIQRPLLQRTLLKRWLNDLRDMN